MFSKLTTTEILSLVLATFIFAIIFEVYKS